MHAILCDAIDSGKSSFVYSLVRRLAGDGMRLSGWVTPAFMEGGEKAGHDFVAIEGGAVEDPVPFTRLHPFENSTSFPNLFSDGRGCPFHFNAAAFDRAAHLTDRLSPVTGHGSRVTDLFVMDEIGPLELIHRRGFQGAMRAAFAAAPATITVVRTGLDALLQKALPDISFRILSLDAARREESLLFRAKLG